MQALSPARRMKGLPSLKGRNWKCPSKWFSRGTTGRTDVGFPLWPGARSPATLLSSVLMWHWRHSCAQMSYLLHFISHCLCLQDNMLAPLTLQLEGCCHHCPRFFHSRSFWSIHSLARLSESPHFSSVSNRNVSILSTISGIRYG